MEILRLKFAKIQEHRSGSVFCIAKIFYYKVCKFSFLPKNIFIAKTYFSMIKVQQGHFLILSKKCLCFVLYTFYFT